MWVDGQAYIVVGNDMRHIKVQTVFYRVLTDMTDMTDMTNGIKEWKRYASMAHGT